MVTILLPPASQDRGQTPAAAGALGGGTRNQLPAIRFAFSAANRNPPQDDSSPGRDRRDGPKGFAALRESTIWSTPKNGCGMCGRHPGPRDGTPGCNREARASCRSVAERCSSPCTAEVQIPRFPSTIAGRSSVPCFISPSSNSPAMHGGSWTGGSPHSVPEGSRRALR